MLVGPLEDSSIILPFNQSFHLLTAYCLLPTFSLPTDSGYWSCAHQQTTNHPQQTTTIPIDLRKKYNLNPGTKVAFME